MPRHAGNQGACHVAIGFFHFLAQVSATFAASLVISPGLGAYVGSVYGDMVAVRDLFFLFDRSVPPRNTLVANVVFGHLPSSPGKAIPWRSRGALCLHRFPVVCRTLPNPILFASSEVGTVTAHAETVESTDVEN